MNQSYIRFYVRGKNRILLFLSAPECIIYSSIKFVLYLSKVVLVDCFNLIINGKLNFPIFIMLYDYNMYSRFLRNIVKTKAFELCLN